jgi:hypothetical protein
MSSIKNAKWCGCNPPKPTFETTVLVSLARQNASTYPLLSAVTLNPKNSTFIQTFPKKIIKLSRSKIFIAF